MREVFIPGPEVSFFISEMWANTGSDYLRLVSIIKRCLPFEGVQLREVYILERCQS